MDDWYAAELPSAAQLTIPKLQEKAETIENRKPSAVREEAKRKYDLAFCAANLEFITSCEFPANWASSMLSIGLELVKAIVSGCSLF